VFRHVLVTDFLKWDCLSIAAPVPSVGRYDLLGIEIGAAEKQIKKAYRDLSLKWHPDKVSKSRTYPGLFMRDLWA